MAPIDEALADSKLREPGESLLYRQTARKYGAKHTTLARRHQGITQPHAVKKQQQQHELAPPQETELVKHTRDLSKRHTPLTRNMIQNFAS